MMKRIWKLCIIIACLISVTGITVHAQNYIRFRNVEIHYGEFICAMALCAVFLVVTSYNMAVAYKKRNAKECEALPDNKTELSENEHSAESIKKGFENEEFKVYLQFLVDSKSKDVVAAEALSRWQHPQKGLLNPGQFLEALDNTGLLSELDFYMFERVCRLLESWEGTELAHIKISCNFNRATLSRKDFVGKITGISNKYDFEKGKLCIEITEDAIEKSFEDATKNVSECKKLGFEIALDDLGSGYTSLSNLCDYPIDIVKIDRFLIAKADKKRGRDLIGGIIALSRKLDLKVVCEGVETKEQDDFVSEAECDYIQGWYYSKAMPVQECEKMYRVKPAT